VEIVNGYNRKCKDSLGGIKFVWLCKYYKYSRSQIITSGNVLVSFPTTFVYKFESLQGVAINENQEQNEGGKFYNQSISLTFSGSAIRELPLLNTLEYRIITLDNNGIYKVLGLYNGLESGGITYETGSSKNNLNGFKITFTGKEEKESFFMSDPFDIGFIEATYYFLLQNNDFFILQNDDNLTLQNG